MSVIINNFLKNCAARVASPPSGLTVVMGNEGGDMDSVVGSIYLAMLLDEQTSLELHPAVPVVNFPLDELPLRRDVQKIFEELGIDPAALISVHPKSNNFLDIADVRPRMVLYDHNKLKSDQSAFSDLVVGIVDHHFDERAYDEKTQNLRVLRSCGSACTLVAEMYREEGLAVPCAELLIAPIVLDTVNFDKSQKKVTPEDLAAFEWLCAEGGLKDYDHNALFNKLSTWKNDIFNLTVQENLKRDYKFLSFTRSADRTSISCGIASVPCSYTEFVDKYVVDSVIDECEKFTVANRLDVITITFAGKRDGLHSRQIAFGAKPPFIAIFTGYAASSPGDVSFSSEGEHISLSGFAFRVYNLSDPTVSRKRLVPSLLHYLKEDSTSSL